MLQTLLSRAVRRLALLSYTGYGVATPREPALTQDGVFDCGMFLV